MFPLTVLLGTSSSQSLWTNIGPSCHAACPRIKIVKALSDNYMQLRQRYPVSSRRPRLMLCKNREWLCLRYLVVATDSARAVAIDPAEGEKTAALCKSLEVS